MGALGLIGYAGIRKQNAYNTFLAADDFARINSCSVAKIPEFIELDVIQNSRLPQTELMGNETVVGDIAFPLNVDDMFGLLMKDLLGSETYSLLAAGVGSHEFVPHSTFGLPNGFSLEYSNDPTIADNVWKAHGGNTNQIGIAIAAGQPLAVTAGCMFRDQVKGGTDQTPVTYGANARYCMSHTGTALVGGNPVDIVSGQLTIGAGLIGGRFNLGSKLALQPVAGMYAVGGQLVLRFTDLSQVNEFLAGTASSVDLVYAVETVSGQQLRVEFAFDNIYWRGEVPKPSGTGEMMLTLPFVGKNGTAANLARVLLVNGVTAAY